MYVGLLSRIYQISLMSHRYRCRYCRTLLLLARRRQSVQPSSRFQPLPNRFHSILRIILPEILFLLFEQPQTHRRLPNRHHRNFRTLLLPTRSRQQIFPSTRRHGHFDPSSKPHFLHSISSLPSEPSHRRRTLPQGNLDGAAHFEYYGCEVPEFESGELV